MNAIYKHFRNSIPENLKSSRLAQARLVLAFVFALLVVLQLFSFERFPAVLGQFTLLRDQDVAKFVAIGIVLVEILAIPFLLGLRFDRRLLAASKWFGVSAALFWYVVECWGVAQPVAPATSAILGDTISVPFGNISIFIAASLLVATVSSSHGKIIWQFLSRLTASKK